MEISITSYLYDISFLITLLMYYLAFRIVYFIYKNFLRARYNLPRRYGQNSWAMVTGATDGIGKSLCEDLAKSGLNVILVSRTLSKLNKVAEEIRKANPKIQTHVIEYDFDRRTKLEDYMEVFSKLQEKFDISILINNVGTDQHNSFDRLNLNYMLLNVNLNIIPQTMLTKLFLKGMNKRNDRSAIITLSSFAGEFPFPNKALYAATKSFSNILTISLMEETKDTHPNIDWLSVKPLEVETLLSTTKADGFSVITSQKCAEGILNDLGYETETYSHWAHKVQAFALLNLVPRRLFNFVVRKYWFSVFIKRDEKTD